MRNAILPAAARSRALSRDRRTRGRVYPLRWRILDRMRRFFRPTLRRPFPVFFVPTRVSAFKSNAMCYCRVEPTPDAFDDRRLAADSRQANHNKSAQARSRAAHDLTAPAQAAAPRFQRRDSSSECRTSTSKAPGSYGLRTKYWHPAARERRMMSGRTMPLSRMTGVLQVSGASASSWQSGKAVDIGQPQVENDQVGLVAVGRRAPLAAGAGQAHGEALLRKLPRQARDDRSLVVDDENPVRFGRRGRARQCLVRLLAEAVLGQAWSDRLSVAVRGGSRADQGWGHSALSRSSVRRSTGRSSRGRARAG